ncbi:MAG TPA: hypothetical protein VGL39_01585 [Jatrophihabitantaceae bacterium]
MDSLLPSTKTVGFAAAETSKCDELAVAARHCAATGAVLLVSSTDAAGQLATIHESTPGIVTVADPRIWNSRYATEDTPTLIEDGLPIFTLEEWTSSMLATSKATAILTPSFCIKVGDRLALRAVLDATSTAATIPGLVTFIAIDAAALTSSHIADFLADMAATPSRRFAFLFADKSKPLAKYDRLQGLRKVLAAFPGSWILGVDALAGTDALAHGAGWVAVGASSSRRWPRRPGDTGGAPLAEGFLPGTFLRSILEFRSPAIYADWYANARSPRCDTCGRNLDFFEPTPADKARIITHNLHAISDFAGEVMTQPESARPEWLNQERVEAFLRHAALTSMAKRVEADYTLRYLCEIDDPMMRETTPAGGWK